MAQKRIYRLLNPFLLWRLRHVSERVYVVWLAVLVGVLAGLAAVLLKTIIHWQQHRLAAAVTEPNRVFALSIYPVIGITLTALVTKYLLGGNLGRGIGPIIYSAARENAVVPRSKLYSQLVTAFLTVSFGGSAGTEAPISVTGAAIGSNAARVLRAGRRRRRLLTGCGAAAGVAAIFNAPIAGVLFAVEAILLELPAQYFIPLLISSATATVVSKALYAGQPFTLITNSWVLNTVPFYALLGPITALFSVYMIRTYHWFDHFVERWPGLRWQKVLAGGAALGLLIFLFPPLYGEGYTTVVQKLLDGHAQDLTDDSLFSVYGDNNVWWLLVLVFFTMMMKVVATSITVGAGGNGGMFGSSLVAGALCGFLFARLVNLTGLVALPEVHFVVLGMAGVLAGVVHAPLTAIFLIAEITGGYALFVPLMLVTSFSYLITKHFEPYSVYTRKLTLKGVDVYANRDQDLLSRLDLHRLIDTNFQPLRPGATLGELVEVFRHAHRDVFPVVGKSGLLRGIITLDMVRDTLFDGAHYTTTRVRELMQPPPALIHPADTAEHALALLERTATSALPVCDTDGLYLGFITKNVILARYRRELIEEGQA
ncbi:chloride channel protein [Hymenobacter sp. BT559]|jgi:CIC family chloride channel protein|uniref:chloride channel protein n=1 Tax=Hymenobacter sp. BT559 TaxID=2795729 RepID=UPI0018EE0C37|nr:chloride channel protein [Hymenobacter sp. BT559]MBJ6141875.1 chloride channel protein [Hymenobacter sp. BT559]